MTLKCICGFQCERNGDLIYHIDTDPKHREQTGSQLYELILEINKQIESLYKRAGPSFIADFHAVQIALLKSLLDSSSLTEKQPENP